MKYEQELDLLENHDSVVDERRELLWEDGLIECYDCGTPYKQPAQHWSMGVCDWPCYTSEQWEILVGSIMGDATVNYHKRDNKNSLVEIYNTNKKYLEYINNQFPVFMDGVKLKSTASQLVQTNRESGWNEDADVEDYHDYYRLRTSSDPRINLLAEWYTSGSKVFPSELELTPTIARHWFCQDGSLSTHTGCVSIHSVNESGDITKIENMFESAGFDVHYSSNVIQFSVDETVDFLKWLGSPPPGMEYKWNVEV